MGHEWMGIVEEVGAQVRTIKKGDRVISPFLISDGTCEFCREGLPSSCVHGGRCFQYPEAGRERTLLLLPPEGKYTSQTRKGQVQMHWGGPNDGG